MPRPSFIHPRHAASLILWRQAGSGTVEVLMGVRSGGHRFMPGRMVFPGGRVDFADRTAPAASELRPATRAALERRAPPLLARALAVAATRELAEETGLVLGGDRPELSRLDYLCRAVTPASLPQRFNARFLIAPAEAASGRLGGSGELEGLGWQRPAALADRPLAPITARVLVEFQDWLALPPTGRAGRGLICFHGIARRIPEAAGSPEATG